MDLYNILLQKQVDGGGDGGSEPIIESLSVTENGTYSVPSGVDGYNPITVDVSGGGGDHDVEDAFVTGTIDTYTNNRVTTIGAYAFYNQLSLQTVNFPNVTSIGNSAFQNCYSLTTANFSNAILIEGTAFYNCYSLTTASFPNATSIGDFAFYNCYSLTTASFPNVTNIGKSAFYNCRNLTTANFPSVTSIGSGTFLSCSKLMSLYLLGSSVPKLGNSSVFNTTPMSKNTYTGSFGSIYVPASLVDSYKTAANWNTYSARITAYTE